MTPVFFQFAKNFTLYIIVIAGLLAYPLYKYGDAVVIEGLIANLLLFFFITLGSIAYIYRNGTKSKDILNSFMLTLVGKMLIALVYFMLVLKGFKGHELNFALTFFAAYLVCTAFEVYFLLRNLRQI